MNNNVIPFLSGHTVTPWKLDNKLLVLIVLYKFEKVLILMYCLHLNKSGIQFVVYCIPIATKFPNPTSLCGQIERVSMWSLTIDPALSCTVGIQCT